MGITTPTIKTAVNGFTIEYRDPADRASEPRRRPLDRPYKTVVCKIAEDVSAVVTSILPIMLTDEEEDNPADEFQVGVQTSNQGAIVTEPTENTKTQAEIDAEIAGANADAAVSAAAQPDVGMTPAQKAAATKAAKRLPRRPPALLPTRMKRRPQ